MDAMGDREEEGSLSEAEARLVDALASVLGDVQSDGRTGNKVGVVGTRMLLTLYRSRERCDVKTFTQQLGNVSAVSVSTWIDRLVKTGLIGKEADTRDLRRRRVYLTAKGRQYVRSRLAQFCGRRS